MKRVSKKIGAIILALAMCMSLCCTALVSAADAGTYTITVSNSISTSTYSAYKIFDVTYDDNGNYSYTIQSTSAWYEFFTDEANAAIDGYDMPFSFTETTVSGTYNVAVAEKEEGVAYSDEEIIDYLQAAIASLAYDDENGWDDTKLTDYGFAGSEQGNGGTITIDVSEYGSGYYFVTTTTGSIVSITTTDPNATIIDKQTPPPDIEKVIVHDDSDDALAEADGMGEEVSFDVTATVPITEDDNYVLDYTITDSMTNGLLIELTEDQFDYDATTGKYYLKDEVINEWIKLTDGAGQELTFTEYVYSYSFELTGYDVYTDETSGENVHTFSGFTLTYYTYNVDLYKENLNSALEAAGLDVDSIWPDYPSGWPDSTEIPADFDFDSESYFEAYDATTNTVGTVYPANASLEIAYSAHVTSLEGYENTNTITMKHDITPFNHPTPWSPVPGPEKFARDYVFSWEMQILKVDGKDNITPLEGATFTLESSNMKDVKVGHSYLYVPIALFDDGVYTDDEGNTYNFVDFESTHYIKDGDKFVVGEGEDDNDTYVRILTSEASVEDTSSTYTVTATTDANGEIDFGGLGTGVYTLTEITAPDGYNLLTEPIVFEITFEETGDEETGYVGIFTVTYGTINEDGEFVPNPDGEGTTLDNNYILVQTVENLTGTELPGTGGIGTTIFYIIGGVLVVGAVVVLVTRRRVHREA